MRDPNDYDRSGRCKECGMFPDPVDAHKNHGHIGHDQACWTEAREDMDSDPWLDETRFE